VTVKNANDFEIRAVYTNANDNLPSEDCLQYYKGRNSGTVRNFNYKNNVNTGQHLNNQDYKICVDKDPAKKIEVSFYCN